MPNDADAEEKTQINVSTSPLSTGSSHLNPLGSNQSSINQPSDNDATVLTSSTGTNSDELAPGLSPRELSHALKGQLLGHFHLQEFIGGGGMGVVFKALDTTLDRIVAVKVVASESISGDDLQRRFLIEAQSTARLDHPHIARIHFVGRDRGLPYIVFEYIDGVNLRDMVMNHGPLPLGDALTYTCQIADALAHAWQKEVVHRDIKPSNILISREQQAKLVDMGLARFYQKGPTDNDLTNTGVTLGTFDYISPEQARDPREADTRSDIYSLGCTLFYILAGRPPFADGTPVQKLLKHQDQTPPRLSDIRPEVPESVSQLVSQMLEKSPELRPQSPSDVVARCYQILQDLGLSPPSFLAPPQPILQSTTRPAWQAHLPWAIPLTALLAATSFWMSDEADPTKAKGFSPLKQFAPTSTADTKENKDTTHTTEAMTATVTETEAAQATQKTTPEPSTETSLKKTSPSQPIKEKTLPPEPTSPEASVTNQTQFDLKWNLPPSTLLPSSIKSLLDFPEGETPPSERTAEPPADEFPIQSILPPE